MSKEDYFQTMVVWPGNEMRQEGQIFASPFGDNVEMPISAIFKELHIHVRDKQTYVALDNPTTGGPIIACSEGKQVVLIPGEQIVLNDDRVTFIAKKGCYFQFIFLNQQKGENS